MEFKADKNPIIRFTLDGKVEITFTTYKSALGGLDDLKDKDLNVKVTSFIKKRSLSQNDYMWVLLDELAKIVTNYGIIADGKLAEEITAEELKARCTNYVKILCNKNKEALSLIKNEYPDIKAEIKDKELRIFSHLDKTAQMNTLLVKNEINVSEIAGSEGSFEDYFIERLGK